MQCGVVIGLCNNRQHPSNADLLRNVSSTRVVLFITGISLVPPWMPYSALCQELYTISIRTKTGNLFKAKPSVIMLLVLVNRYSVRITTPWAEQVVPMQLIGLNVELPLGFRVSRNYKPFSIFCFSQLSSNDNVIDLKFAVQTLFAASVCLVLTRIFHVVTTPLRNLPGPTFARFTKLRYPKRTFRNDFRWYNIDLQGNFGPIVRLASNQYSIDRPERSEADLRHWNALRKIRMVWFLGKSRPSCISGHLSQKSWQPHS